MNQFFNPCISLPFLKNYLTDPGRIERLTPQQLERYKNRSLRKILTYASSVPLYQEKYKTAKVNIKDINGIHDITKLPFISKQDLMKNFPDRSIPINYNKNKGYIVGTGGTTGKPVEIYTDFPTMLRGMGPTLRELKHFNLHWRKSRIVHLGNFSRYRIDTVFRDTMLSSVQSFYSLKNVLNIDVNEPLKTIMERLNEFKPDLIISYPAIFQHLAFLKKEGQGEQVNPKLLQVGGAILDEYTRSYVEDVFHCPLLNVYPSVEAGADIAFECEERNWHIHSDFFHLEAINEQNELVSPGERGHIVITRLWGRGTPIIRYTGMDDWITLSDDKKCSCGLKGPIFEKPVEGRMRANIVLPNGKVFPAGAFCFISPVLHDLKTFKVKQFQIIQRKINEIEILLVIDENLRDTGASFEQISEGIIKIYKEKAGDDVNVTVKEVKEIPTDPTSRKPPPIVISYVTLEEGYRKLSSS